MTKVFGESFIVISDNSSGWINFLDCYKDKYAIKKENVLLADEPIIKIEHIRKIKNKLSLKPSKNEIILAVILNAQNMTKQAQNAFLKILEEPPYYAVIILFVKNVYGLVPTIVSRCKKIRIERHIHKDIPGDLSKIYDKIEQSKYIYEKLGIAAAIAKDEKTDIKTFLRYYIYYSKNKSSIKYNTIKSIDRYKNIYKIGINKKLFLENLLLEI